MLAFGIDKYLQCQVIFFSSILFIGVFQSKECLKFFQDLSTGDEISRVSFSILSIRVFKSKELLKFFQVLSMGDEISMVSFQQSISTWA